MTEEAEADRRVKKQWMKWFALDWLGDEALQSCSISARGVAANLFTYTGCRSPIPGMFVLPNGKKPSIEQAALILRCTSSEAEDALNELLEAKAIRKDPDDIIYSMRQVRLASESSKNSSNARTRWDSDDRVKTKNQTDTAHRICEIDATNDATSDAPSVLCPLSSDFSDLNESDQTRAIADPAPQPSHAGRPSDAHVASLAPPAVACEARGYLPPMPTTSHPRANGALAMPIPLNPDDFIANDAFGHEFLRGLWNKHRAPKLKPCEELQRVEQRNLALIIGADPRHRTRQWWETWIKRTHSAKFLPHKTSGAATFAWFLRDEERIAALLRGEYDIAPVDRSTTAGSATPYRKPAGTADYSRDEELPKKGTP